MRKKLLVAGVTAALFFLCFCVGAVAGTSRYEVSAVIDPSVDVCVNGSQLRMKDGNGAPLYPILYNGNAYVPIRAFSTAMGASVGWNGSNSSTVVSYTPPAINAYKFADNVKLVLNNKQQSWPIINDGMTNFVSVRSLATALGATVTWNGNTRTISVNP